MNTIPSLPTLKQICSSAITQSDPKKSVQPNRFAASLVFIQKKKNSTEKQWSAEVFSGYGLQLIESSEKMIQFFNLPDHEISQEIEDPNQFIFKTPFKTKRFLPLFDNLFVLDNFHVNSIDDKQLDLLSVNKTSRLGIAVFGEIPVKQTWNDLKEISALFKFIGGINYYDFSSEGVLVPREEELRFYLKVIPEILNWGNCSEYLLEKVPNKNFLSQIYCGLLLIHLDLKVREIHGFTLALRYGEIPPIEYSSWKQGLLTEAICTIDKPSLLDPDYISKKFDEITEIFKEISTECFKSVSKQKIYGEDQQIAFLSSLPRPLFRRLISHIFPVRSLDIDMEAILGHLRHKIEKQIYNFEISRDTRSVLVRAGRKVLALEEDWNVFIELIDTIKKVLPHELREGERKITKLINQIQALWMRPLEALETIAMYAELFYVFDRYLWTQNKEDLVQIVEQITTIQTALELASPIGVLAFMRVQHPKIYQHLCGLLEIDSSQKSFEIIQGFKKYFNMHPIERFKPFVPYFEATWINSNLDNYLQFTEESQVEFVFTTIQRCLKMESTTQLDQIFLKWYGKFPEKLTKLANWLETLSQNETAVVWLELILNAERIHRKTIQTEEINKACFFEFLGLKF